MTVTIDRCPLCGSGESAEHSIPGANLYSEKLASLLGIAEEELLATHANWRCANCDLIFKRRWFDDAVVARLFAEAVAVHPRGWDTVSGRFSPAGVHSAVERWASGLGTSTVEDVRQGERELRSIIGALTNPTASGPCLEALADGDVAGVRASADAVAAAIGDPAPFSRFSGFRSRELWDYLQSRTGGVGDYAEVGCPLWGLLPIAAESGASATLLLREEPNYWGDGCRMAGEQCTTKLLADRGLTAAQWSEPGHYSMIGLFQYLDHLTDPRGFLGELFAKAASAALVLDGVAAPVAIQHVTGWTDASMAYVADSFGKTLHTDFDAIRPSGNVLYLLTGPS